MSGPHKSIHDGWTPQPQEPVQPGDPWFNPEDDSQDEALGFARAAAPAGETDLAYIVQMAEPPHLGHSLNVWQDDCPACDSRSTQADSGMGDAPSESAAPALTVPPAPVPAAGLREALVDAMEAHEDGRRGGAYPHLGQTNDIRRFVDWIVDWMEKFTPAALLDSNRPGLDVERDKLREEVESLRERLAAFSEGDAKLRDAFEAVRNGGRYPTKDEIADAYHAGLLMYRPAAHT